jgi:hypothetical protein
MDMVIQTVVIACLASACPMQFDDQKGYFEGPHALQHCQLRGAEMIYELVQRQPLYSAQTLCVTVKKSEAVPAKPHTYEKPDNVEERAI